MTQQHSTYPPQQALDITIEDVLGQYTAEEVEGALEEVMSKVVSEDLWDRAGTILDTHNAGDSVRTTGTMMIGNNTTQDSTILLNISHDVTGVTDWEGNLIYMNVETTDDVGNNVYGENKSYTFSSAGKMGNVVISKHQHEVADQVGDVSNKKSVTGFYRDLIISDDIYGDFYGFGNDLDLSSCTLSDDFYGKQETFYIADVGGDAFFNHNTLDSGGTVTGTTYGYYYDDIGLDYLFYQNGTAPSKLNGNLDIGASTFTVNSIEIVGADGEVNKAAVEDSTNWDAAYTHVSNDGTDHTYIDQDLRAAATGVDFGSLQLGGAGAIVAEFSTDGTLSGNSDTAVPTEQAVKTYADGLLAANDAMTYKGAIDCSTNPDYTAADAGHTYKVSVAGKIGGASGPNVEIGDMLICLVDSTASGDHATVGSSWNVIQVNIDGAVIGPTSSTDHAIARFDLTTGKLIQNSSVTIDDAGTINIPSGQKYQINSSDLDADDIGDGAVYAIVTKIQETNWDTHLSSNGSDHSYINQDVTSGSAPTFTADNFSDGGGNAIITTTQETNFGTAYSHTSLTNNPHSTSDANLTTTDVATNNASTSKHGFLKKLDNDATHFMDGHGAWSVPISLPQVWSATNEAVQTHTGDTNYSEKLTLDRTWDAGDYIVHWYCELSVDDAVNLWKLRIHLDDSTILAAPQDELENAGDYRPVGGSYPVTFTNAQHFIDLDIATDNALTTVSVRYARIWVEKVNLN